jgi:hypothetical protein
LSGLPFMVPKSVIEGLATAIFGGLATVADSKSREKYIELYDFTPVGYLSWRKSMIFSISLVIVSCSLSRM